MQARYRSVFARLRRLVCRHDWRYNEPSSPPFRYCVKCMKLEGCQHSWHPRQQFIRDGHRWATYVCIVCGEARDEPLQGLPETTPVDRRGD